MAITHKYTIMCDQVRREDNLKWLLLGVYEDNMAVPQIPAQTLGLTFFMRLESDRLGVWNAQLHLDHLETGERLFSGMATLNFQRPGPAMIPVPTPPLLFRAVGAYQFVFEIQGQENNPIIHNFTLALNIPGGPGVQGRVA
jgi:hypothetical protein